MTANEINNTRLVFSERIVNKPNTNAYLALDLPLEPQGTPSAPFDLTGTGVWAFFGNKGYFFLPSGQSTLFTCASPHPAVILNSLAPISLPDFIKVQINPDSGETNRFRISNTSSIPGADYSFLLSIF